MMCPMCNVGWKSGECPHSAAQIEQYYDDLDHLELIDKRLVALGVVEKTHPGILAAQRLRQRKRKQRRGH